MQVGLASCIHVSLCALCDLCGSIPVRLRALRDLRGSISFLLSVDLGRCGEKRIHRRTREEHSERQIGLASSMYSSLCALCDLCGSLALPIRLLAPHALGGSTSVLLSVRLRLCGV